MYIQINIYFFHLIYILRFNLKSCFNKINDNSLTIKTLTMNEKNEIQTR